MARFFDRVDLWMETMLRNNVAKDSQRLFEDSLIIKVTLDWTKYDFSNKASHPPKYGRYLIYRAKCDKMHFEIWNGNGWASSNNDCTHWTHIKSPTQPI